MNFWIYISVCCSVLACVRALHGSLSVAAIKCDTCEGGLWVQCLCSKQAGEMIFDGSAKSAGYFAPCEALTRHVWAFVLEARAGRIEGTRRREKGGVCERASYVHNINPFGSGWSACRECSCIQPPPPRPPFPLTFVKENENNLCSRCCKH